MRLALDEASGAADRGDAGFGAVVARAGQILARAAVPKSLIAIRSPTTASPLSAEPVPSRPTHAAAQPVIRLPTRSTARPKAEALTITMPVRGLVVVL
jgi:hypothetical protein